MKSLAQNPSVVLDGKPAFCLSSLAFRLLESDRLAVAVIIALFLVACAMDEADYRLMHPAPVPAISTGQAAPRVEGI